MTARRLALAALALLPLPATVAPVAQAAFERPKLVSVSPAEQAAVALAPALSGDGRYVAFEGTIGGQRGVFRKALVGGALELVSGGDAYAGDEERASATAPSISTDGRYVSFTTRAPLDPANDPAPATGDVYVRDMAAPLPPGGACAVGAPCPFELASALDGSRAGIGYTGSGGSIAAGRVALSANGRRVAFVVSSPSNLTGGPEASTPAGQVVLRDLDTLDTVLVSARRDPLTGAMTELPAPSSAVVPSALPGRFGVAAPGASLSADGSTVAWLGTALQHQVPTLGDERAVMEAGSGKYVEPLWRRVADGPAAPTRRIVGGADPLAPGCPADGTLAVPACRGPFPGLIANYERSQAPEGPTGWLVMARFLNGVPQLSADGRAVALIGDPTAASNLFVVDMGEGLTRRQALRQLTAEIPLHNGPAIGAPENVDTNGDVWDVAISPDGGEIAFATARTRYPLAPPVLVGEPPTRIGLIELYRLDLAGQAFERVTAGSGGSASIGPGGGLGGGGANSTEGKGASSPSFSADGRTIAYASFASNLVGRDANEADDVFVSTESGVPGGAPPKAIGAPPPPRAFRPDWRLSVRAVSRRNGSVRLDVVVPGPGRVRAVARARLRAGAGAKPVRVAAARARTRLDGVVTLSLRLSHPFRHIGRRKAGLTATTRVRFVGRGGKALSQTLSVRFRERRR